MDKGLTHEEFIKLEAARVVKAAHMKLSMETAKKKNERVLSLIELFPSYKDNESLAKEVLLYLAKQGKIKRIYKPTYDCFILLEE